MMQGRNSGRVRRALSGALAVCALAGLIVVPACSKKINTVDPGFVPEGTPSPSARLLIWPDEANAMPFYRDVAPADPDPGDVFLGVEEFRRSVPGANHGIILDHTDASEYQAYRTESSGGMARFQDFDVPRTRAWIESQWEAYHFIDVSPAGVSTPTYVGRGLRGGVASATSPLTNTALLGDRTIQNLKMTAIWFPRNGKLKLKWDNVPNAARYLIQVYELRSDIPSFDEQVLAGTAAPFYDGRSRDFFLGFIDEPNNLYFVGDSSRSDVEILTIKPMTFGLTYLARMAAIDANGRMIAINYGLDDIFAARIAEVWGLARGFAGEGTYSLYRLCAQVAQDTSLFRGPDLPSFVLRGR
jgi:hypothetical protein